MLTEQPSPAMHGVMTVAETRESTRKAMREIRCLLATSEAPLSQREVMEGLARREGQQRRRSATADLNAVFELLVQGLVEYDDRRRLVLTDAGKGAGA